MVYPMESIMAESGEVVGASLWDVISKVPDPRDASGKRFPLQGILALTVAALLAGRPDLSAIARWGRGCSKRQLTRLGIDRPKSPCHATYHNVFKALDAAAMEKALAGWAKEALPAGAAVAIDGKTLPLLPPWEERNRAAKIARAGSVEKAPRTY